MILSDLPENLSLSDREDNDVFFSSDIDFSDLLSVAINFKVSTVNIILLDDLHILTVTLLVYLILL